MIPRTAILLINTGSPDSAAVGDVRRYLSRFLTNPRVIDIPRVWRWLLVNAVIVPKRAPHSSKLYKQLWTENGAPLVYYALCVKDKLQEELAGKADVYIGMSFGNPTVGKALRAIKEKGYESLIVLPMFPQYASSSSGVAIDEVMREVRIWKRIPELRIINQFYQNNLFIDAFASQINKYKPHEYDHVLFTYHGLPLKHVQQQCTSDDCANCACEQMQPPIVNTICYKAACYETTRLLATKLNLSRDKYSVGFQSRMGKAWLQPYTDKLIVAKARQGAKNILVVAPAFVADCLETTVEIGIDYKKLFMENGGQRLQLVDSLNNNAAWIAALKDILINTFPIGD